MSLGLSKGQFGGPASSVSLHGTLRTANQHPGTVKRKATLGCKELTDRPEPTIRSRMLCNVWRRVDSVFVNLSDIFHSVHATSPLHVAAVRTSLGKLLV